MVGVVQDARVAWSMGSEMALAPTMQLAGSVTASAIDNEVVIGPLYNDKTTTVSILAEMDGAEAGAFPGFFAYVDDPASPLVFQAEVEGNTHGSLIFPYESDNGRGRPPRLLGQPIEGQPDADEILFRFHAADSAYRISESLSKGWADVPTTSDAVFTLERKRGGVSSVVATVTFQPDNNEPTIEVSDSGLLLGDRLIFHAPVIQDDTLADLIVTFVLIFT